VKVTGDIKVMPGTTLTINPSTYVEFQGHYKIKVAGAIRAVGTPNDSIIFTIRDTTGFWQSTYDVTGGWGGIILSGSSLPADTSVFEYCRMQYAKKYDTAGLDIKGGAIMASDYKALIIKNCCFRYNMVINHEYGSYNDSASQGGAVYCTNVNYTLIASSRFERNRSHDAGGAIWIGDMCNAEISGNIFLNNKAWNMEVMSGYMILWGEGAAIGSKNYNNQCIIISGNRYFNNYAVDAIIHCSNLEARIFNNLICNNYGTGISTTYYFSHACVYNNTIVNNETTDGGIFLYCNGRFFNNIVWGNRLPLGKIEDQIQRLYPGTMHPDLFNNCLQKGNGGPNSIYLDPEFVNPTRCIGLYYNAETADWSLEESSPCIDHGSKDTTGLGLPAFDIEGKPRIIGAFVDIGCYESRLFPVGIDEIPDKDHNLVIFPNPASGNITLALPEKFSHSAIQIVNTNGRVMLSTNADSPEITFDISAFPPGLYFVRLSNEKTVEVGKFVKQ